MKKYLLSFVLFTTVLQLVLAQTTYTYTGKPKYNVHVKRGGISLGDFKLELYPKIAPKHVRNFDSLVSTQFYDTTAFHRVIPGFMIQGGDPNSRHGAVNTWGFGQPSQPKVNAEFSILKHVRGILSAARSSNINSATSQFFVCVATASQLDGSYSIYGRTTEGMNWVDTIVDTPRNAQDRPLQKIEMFITYIGSNDSIPAKPTLTLPSNGKVWIDTLSNIQLKWNAVPGSLLYHLEVSTDSLFVNDTIKSINLLNTSYTLVKPHLASTVFYWRVTANNGGNTSTSQVWNFRTMDAEYVGIKESETQNNTITMFPNPSFGKFYLKGGIIGSFVEVFDANGKLIHVQKLFEEDANIILPEKSKGVHFYQVIEKGKIIKTGKILVK
jgi:peptidyl-prolyl cis-trans isomerase B (cyclophilin B)